MILQESRDRIRNLMSIFVHQVKCAVAMGQTDLMRDSETVLTPLLSVVYNCPNLKNLNATEGSNFPAIDLADDEARVAFQITSRKDLGKVRHTLQMFTTHELYKKYDSLFIYVLTERQGSYSEDRCNEIVQGKFDFRPDRDILDYRDILKIVGDLEIGKTLRVQEVLEDHIGEDKAFQSVLGSSPVPKEFVDNHIEKEIEFLRKARYFSEFDEIDYASVFGARLSEGEYRGGTNSVRSQGLVWCARILSTDKEELGNAEKYVRLAKSLGGDTRIADAFVRSQRGDKDAAKKIMADVDSSDRRFSAYLSAAFRIIGNHDGPQTALDWLKVIRTDVSKLDPEGKLTLLSYQLELLQWKEAFETSEALCASELEEAPVLHFLKAMAYLLSTVPLEFRHAVFSQVPFEGEPYYLDSRETAIEARRTAQSHFAHAAETARKLKCPIAATIPDRYALWLELEDPEYCERGKQCLATKLNDLESALHLVPLGLQYGIPLDLADVEQEIERQIALRGDVSLNAARACLALARVLETPEATAKYFDRHYDIISSLLDEKVIRAIQIAVFAKAGMFEKANKCLALLLKEGLTEVEKSRLRIEIEEGEGKDTLEARKELFRKTDSIVELESLVYRLGPRREWVACCEYEEILFDRTHSLLIAVRLANALHFAGKSARVIDLLESNDDILSQSTDLQMFYCWALFHEGEILRAHQELTRLDVDWEDENYRTLQISLAIALGDWDSLSLSISSGYRQTENRSARELVKAAEFSLYLKLDSAKELLFAAAEKGNDDANVLSHAYFLATRAGWESDPETASWLQRAVELSGEDGPLRPVTINDILDLKPEWDRHELSMRQLLNRGESPMFFAAQCLSRSLMNLTLFPAMTNSAQRDLRSKFGIPGFSGQRGPTHSIASGTIGLDYTALLTLSFLNLLEEVFDTFDTVYVPHSALAWLFEERQNASFHQPSKIRDARRVLYLLSTGALQKLTPVTVTDRELSTYVGLDLATVIAEAENAKPGDAQRLVVRPSPVYIAGSLGDEVADLTSHSSVLVSCQAVVEKLSEMAEIEDFEERKALAYLQLQEKTWPHQPEIADDATLYLDDLAVHYLLHAGILEKLCMLDFELYVSSSLVAELNGLIAYESISGKIIDEIETMRSVVKQGIECRRVKVGKWRSFGNGDEQSPDFFHIAGLFAMAEDCDAIVADDRFFNQHQYIDSDGEKTPLFSTIDVLDALVSAGSISPKQRLAARTRLRRAGYFFVPLSEDEINCHLDAAEVKDGKLIERIHLKAIRESILHVRMNDWLQLPSEGPWPETVFGVYINALRNLWRKGADIPRVKVLSDWLWDQLDVHGWAHLFGTETRDETIESERSRIIVLLLTSLDVDVPRNIREAYWAWLEDRVLAPVKEFEPALYTLIIDLKRRQISELTYAVLTEMGQEDE